MNEPMGDKAMSEPLCREPWQSYYILRRGVLPCCYGYKPIAPMAEWSTAWNSPTLQEIRAHLAQGKLSPYCLLSLSCPIVQRQIGQDPEAAAASEKLQEEWAEACGRLPPKRPWILRVANRALGGAPGRIYGRFKNFSPSSRSGTTRTRPGRSDRGPRD